MVLAWGAEYHFDAGVVVIGVEGTASHGAESVSRIVAGSLADGAGYNSSAAIGTGEAASPS